MIKTNLVLNVQSAVALNFVLPVGTASESTTVDASSFVINSTGTSVGTIVNRKFVEKLRKGFRGEDLLASA
ncbi:hypothetical protein HDF15_004664 [Granulicella mallensis]|uniref:Uncharacterized protein n=1 Tax=Granulicella mallensis TaxID=940614 RepID=A0A7W8EB35_9BACT|nr:hypothetical protein [Granulicella mallensis]